MNKMIYDCLGIKNPKQIRSISVVPKGDTYASDVIRVRFKRGGTLEVSKIEVILLLQKKVGLIEAKKMASEI